MGIAQQAAGARLTAANFNSAPVIISSMSAGSVSNSVAETVIGTFTIPANDPQFPGGYQFTAFATVAATGSPTISIRVRLNSTSGTKLLERAGATASASASVFGITGFVGFAAIGSSGQFGTDLICNDGVTTSAVLTGGLGNNVLNSINTSISNTVLVTVQFGTAASGNTATGIFGSMYRL